MTYSEKLKDPRWQKKRLDIMQRDDFTCQTCGQKSKTLHVHHNTYIFDNDPWDYPDKNLKTLCWECHQEEEYYKSQLQDTIHDLLIEGYTNRQLCCFMESLIHPLSNISKSDRVRFGAAAAGNENILKEIAKRLDLQ